MFNQTFQNQTNPSMNQFGHNSINKYHTNQSVNQKNLLIRNQTTNQWSKTVSKKQTPNNQIPDKPNNQLNSLKDSQPTNNHIPHKTNYRPKNFKRINQSVKQLDTSNYVKHEISRTFWLLLILKWFHPNRG
jgi:hypothetical protein